MSDIGYRYIRDVMDDEGDEFDVNEHTLLALTEQEIGDGHDGRKYLGYKYKGEYVMMGHFCESLLYMDRGLDDATQSIMNGFLRTIR